MRWALGALAIAAAAALLEAILADRLLAHDTVAGLISPQGADLGGIALVLAFLCLRLGVILAFPAFFVGWAGWSLSGRLVGAPRPR
jgi:hypothetical protein